MMPEVIFFLDASCSRYSIALKKVIDGTFDTMSLKSKETRGENLLAEVEKMLDKNLVKISELSLLATTSGPGSLTGIRIALSYIKTIAQVLKIPVCAIPSLFALQESASLDIKKFPVFIQARKNAYYFRMNTFEKSIFQIAEREEAIKIISENQMAVLEEGCDLLCDIESEKYVIGSMKPEKVIEIALEDYKNGNYYDFRNLLPEYGGKSVAEILFEKRRLAGL